MGKIQVNNMQFKKRTLIPFRLLFDLGKVSFHSAHLGLGRLDAFHDGLLVNGSHRDLRASSSITEPVVSDRF